MNTLTAALMLVLLLAPSGFTLECYQCDGAECNDKFEKKETCVPVGVEITTPKGDVEITTPKGDVEITTPKGDVEITTPKGDVEITNKPNPYSFFVRQLKDVDELLRCVKVVYKDGEEIKTKRGCYQLENAEVELDDACKAFSSKATIEECGVCDGDLCNSAKISQMSKALALVFLLPLLRFFY